jgi:hypothetical protein
VVVTDPLLTVANDPLMAQRAFGRAVSLAWPHRC